jgi:predicted Zn-dependent peptidase
MAYNIDVPKTNVPEALEILVDSVVNPKFLSWEVKDAVEKMKADLKAVKDNPQTLLMEVRPFLQATRTSRLGLAALPWPDAWNAEHSCSPPCAFWVVWATGRYRSTL